ncbi:MAG: FMN-binding negative transcriptional regulator [Arenicellales bacterium]|nr:FMN-binding negative transcriptional regulator [Gammaproteobacteria bacterium]
MYNPATFSETDPKVIADLIDSHPLGMLISGGAGGLRASPVPFFLKRSNEFALVAHLARANDHWKDLEALRECLIVFQGANNYVTPSWYPSKAETGKVVPTWNYETVQVRGVPRVIHDTVWLNELVTDLTHRMESKRPEPWAVADAPENFIDAQLKAIVGLEITVTEVTGKWKMSQNRSRPDALGVAAGLANTDDPHHNLLAADKVRSRNR